MTPLMLAVVAVILTALFLVQRKKNRSRLVQLIDKIPGPRAFPIVGTTWEVFLTPRNRRLAHQVEVVQKYKPIMRAWMGSMPAVVLSEPHHVEAVLRDTKHLHKGQMYRFLLPWLGTGLLTSTGSKWHSHRKMITPTFHFTILDHFVEVFAEKTEVMAHKLQKEVGNSGFDIYPYITKCALDIICETAMGTSVNAQNDTESSYVKSVYDMSELITKRTIKPWLYPNFIYMLTRDGKRHGEALQELHSFTTKVIGERKALYKTVKKDGATVDDIGKKRRLAFLDLLIESSEGGAKLTDEEIREEVDTFMFEGHDTTSAGIGWVIFMLGQHPEVQDKVFEELEGIFGDSDRPATMRDLQEMKYLERVIKESLRLYPSVPFVSRFLQDDLDLGDYMIPAGTSVGISIFVLHRNPDQFPDPEKFNPDNFLPENVTKRHPYAYVPFSAGPRNCIGQKFALLEEKTVISTVIRHYKIRALDKREDIKLIAELILRPENGIRVALSPRR